MSKLQKLNPHYKPPFDALKLAKELVEKVNSLLLVGSKINEAYLFGSGAIDMHTSDSDLDLLLVVSSVADISVVYKIVGQPFFSPVAVDWIVKDRGEFDKSKEVGGVCRVAVLTGKRII